MTNEEIDNRIKEFISFNKKEYNKDIINCRPINKKDLIKGQWYDGISRNTTEAKWNGTDFEYNRYKFSSYFIDHINHFEDDNGYDVFIPMKLQDIIDLL